VYEGRKLPESQRALCWRHKLVGNYLLVNGGEAAEKCGKMRQYVYFGTSEASKLSTESQRALCWRHQLVGNYLLVDGGEAAENASVCALLC